MNFEQIRSFISVAKHGSYSTAAKERYISQPAISHQIRGLEEELGMPLFLRNQKNIELTEHGKRFHKYAIQMLALEKDAFNSLNEKADNHYGLLSIAAPWLTISELMDDFFVKIVKQKGKEALFRLMEKEDNDIPNMVLNGELEIGVTNHIINNKNLVYEKAFTEEIALITPNTEKYRNLTSDELRELLLEEGHIRYDFGEGSDFLWNDFFGKTIGRDLHNIKTVARMSQYNLQLAAVESGLGIGFISNICMQKKLRAGKILAYRCEGLLQKPHYVVYNKERTEASEILMYTKNLLIEELGKSIINPTNIF